jgi:3-oxoacyl-[acyl-carrier protein] reductase
VDSGLAGKVVLVTGGSGGIGDAICRMFAEEDARVAVHYFRGQDRADQVKNRLANSHRAITVGSDLRDPASVQRMFQTVESQLGPVEILIANAGVWPSSDVPLYAMSLERWNQTLEVDLTSVFLCVREFVKCAKSNSLNDTATVLIGSTAGFFGEAGHSDYAAAKSGLMSGLLNSLKNEMATEISGARINCVCPGWTLTPMTEKFAGKEAAMKRALQTIPLKKFGRPDDVAAAVVFFASSKLAGHITGQSLLVSGGMEGRVLHSLDEIDLDKIIGQQS